MAFTSLLRYFVGDMECLSVGVRRFPLNILFLEDIMEVIQGKYKPVTTETNVNMSKIPSVLSSGCRKIIESTSKCNGLDVPGMRFLLFPLTFLHVYVDL